MDVDPHIYLRQEGEQNCKALLVIDLSCAVRGVENFQHAEGASLKPTPKTLPQAMVRDDGCGPTHLPKTRVSQLNPPYPTQFLGCMKWAGRAQPLSWLLIRGSMDVRN